MVNVAPTQGPAGLSFAEQIGVFDATAAISEGDLVKVSISAGVYRRVAPTASGDGTPNHVIGVALADAGIGDRVTVGLKGQFKVKCAAAVDEGIAFIVSTVAAQAGPAPTNPAADGTAYTKHIGIALANTGSAGDLTECLFDGINGFAAAGN